MAMYLGDIPVGELVTDATFLHDYNVRMLNQPPNPDGARYDLIRWRVVCQDRCNGEGALLLAESPLYFDYFDNNSLYYSELTDFAMTRPYYVLNNASNSYQGLIRETPKRFRDAIIPISLYQGGHRPTTGVRYFILSQVEYGGGTSGIDGNHGNPIDYFNGWDNRFRRAPTVNQLITNYNGSSPILTRSPEYGVNRGARAMTNYMPGENPTFKAYHSGLIIPAVVLRKDIPVSDFEFMGAKLLFDTDLPPLEESINVKVNGVWRPAPKLAIKKDSLTQ